jgi:hypothetical protein
VQKRDLGFDRIPESARAGISGLRFIFRRANCGTTSVANLLHTENSMDERKYLTAEEVLERYRSSISAGTLRNWRVMRIGPTFIKIGKAVLYPIDELEAWDQKNKVTCRASKQLITDARDST